MDRFTAVVPCYDGVERHNIGRKISYQFFYGTQYLTMKDKLVCNLLSNSDLGIVTDFFTGNFLSYTPLFQPVVSALLRSESINKVVLLGDREVIRQTFEYSGNSSDIVVLNRKESIGSNLFSSGREYDYNKHIFICMPDIPLITPNDVDSLIGVYLDNSDLQHHDLIVGFVTKNMYCEESDIDKKFIQFKLDSSNNFRSHYFKESCGFLVRLSKFNSAVLDRIYRNRKLLMIPQQLLSLISDPRRVEKMKMFGEYVLGKNSIVSISKRLSDYTEGRVNLVLHDVVNFSIDGDSLEDIVKLSYKFR